MSRDLGRDTYSRSGRRQYATPTSAAVRAYGCAQVHMCQRRVCALCCVHSNVQQNCLHFRANWSQGPASTESLWCRRQPRRLSLPLLMSSLNQAPVFLSYQAHILPFVCFFPWSDCSHSQPTTITSLRSPSLDIQLPHDILRTRWDAGTTTA